MLGGRLQINGSMLLLGLMATALSLCALGLALLIAVCSSTTEQATLLGGTGNIILAALGGIMIPKFIMPAAMQSIAQWSPMSWGLEGFLDVLLRSGSLRDIAPEAACLTLLGLTAILLAKLSITHRLTHGRLDLVAETDEALSSNATRTLRKHHRRWLRSGPLELFVVPRISLAMKIAGMCA
jgi:hypothetical protein